MAADTWWKIYGRLVAPAIDKAAVTRAVLTINSFIPQFFAITGITEAELKEATQINMPFKLKRLILIVQVLARPLKGVDPAPAKTVVEQYGYYDALAELADTAGQFASYVVATCTVRFDQLYRAAGSLIDPFLDRVKSEHEAGIADPEELRIYRQFEKLNEEEARRVAGLGNKVDQAVSGTQKENDKLREKLERAELDKAKLQALLDDPYRPTGEAAKADDLDRRNKPR